MRWFRRVAGGSFQLSMSVARGLRRQEPFDCAPLLRTPWGAPIWPVRYSIVFRGSRTLVEKKLKPAVKHRNVSGLSWMGARAVDWARLESVCTARYRGFES